MPGAPADADAMDTSTSQGAKAVPSMPTLRETGAVLADLETAKRQVRHRRYLVVEQLLRSAFPQPHRQGAEMLCICIP